MKTKQHHRDNCRYYYLSHYQYYTIAITTTTMTITIRITSRTATTPTITAPPTSTDCHHNSHDHHYSNGYYDYYYHRYCVSTVTTIILSFAFVWAASTGALLCRALQTIWCPKELRATVVDIAFFAQTFAFSTQAIWSAAN